jgi:hypothetical protein
MVVPEIIKQEEWIEIPGIAESESTAQSNTRSLQRWFCFNDPLDRPNRHGASF